MKQSVDCSALWEKGFSSATKVTDIPPLAFETYVIMTTRINHFVKFSIFLWENLESMAYCTLYNFADFLLYASVLVSSVCASGSSGFGPSI